MELFQFFQCSNQLQSSNSVRNLLKVTLKIITEKELGILTPGSTDTHSTPNIWNITQMPYISEIYQENNRTETVLAPKPPGFSFFLSHPTPVSWNSSTPTGVRGRIPYPCQLMVCSESTTPAHSPQHGLPQFNEWLFVILCTQLGAVPLPHTGR